MINVKGLFETLQHKANNIDSNTPTSEILDTLKAIKIHDGNTVVSYDSDGVLPDAATTNIKLAYIKNTGYFKFNNGTWDILTGELEGQLGVLPGTNQYGTSFGFVAGSSNLQKFSLSSDENATLLSSTSTARGSGKAGQSSSTHGYISGGRLVGPSAYTNIVEKYPFTVDEAATDVGDLTVSRASCAGNQSDDHGYTSGGFYPPNTYSNVIDKFPFTSDASATDVGDVASGTGGQFLASTTSTTHGYLMGGQPAAPDPSDRDITKFSFSTDGNSVDVGDLLNEYTEGAGAQSTTRGYHFAGRSPVQLNPSVSNIIEGFPFASDGNSTDVGDLLQRIYYGSGVSSSTHGYMVGGYSNSPEPVTGALDFIQKFSFTTDGDATDIADLATATTIATTPGTQY